MDKVNKKIVGCTQEYDSLCQEAVEDIIGFSEFLQRNKYRQHFIRIHKLPDEFYEIPQVR